MAAVVLHRFSGGNPEDWIFQAKQYFAYLGFPEKDWLPLPFLYLDGEALDWFGWMYRNKQFWNWKHFKEKLALRFRARTSPESPMVHSQITRILTLLQQLQDKYSGVTVKDATDSAPTMVSGEITDISEVHLEKFDTSIDTHLLLAGTDSVMEDEHSGHADQVFDESSHQRENPVHEFDTALQVTQLVSKATWCAEFAYPDATQSRKSTAEEDECLETTTDIVFDGNLQRNEFDLQCQFAHPKLIVTAKSVSHMILPSDFDELTGVEGKASIAALSLWVEFFPCLFTQTSLTYFGDLAMCESMKNGLPACYWFDTRQHLSPPILFVFRHKKCGAILFGPEFVKIDALLAFDAQGGGVIIMGHDETLLFGDANRKYMEGFEFVSMRQSTHTAQTRPRYFLLFSISREVWYILGCATIFYTCAYSYSMTQVWDPGQCWCVNPYISEIIEHQIVGVDISDLSSGLGRLTSSADMLVETVFFTLIALCQRTADCLMICDKIPQRCVVCWIGWIKAYERTENCEAVFSLFYFIQHGYVIFGRLSIVICNANPFIGTDFNCGGSAMFNTCHFFLMVSLSNKTSSLTFVPHAIVNLAKENIVTWLATKGASCSSTNSQLSKLVKICLPGINIIIIGVATYKFTRSDLWMEIINLVGPFRVTFTAHSYIRRSPAMSLSLTVIKTLFLGHPGEEVEGYLARDVAFSEHVLVGSSYSLWEIFLFYGTGFGLLRLLAARMYFKNSSSTHMVDLDGRSIDERNCYGVYDTAVREHSQVESNIFPSHVGILQCVHQESDKIMQTATLCEATGDNVVTEAGYKTLFMELLCRTLLRRFFGHQSSVARSVKDPRHVRKFFVYVQLWAFDNNVVGARLYNSNLEDKVLIGAGGIVMNGPRPVLAKQPNTIKSGYVWDPA